MPYARNKDSVAICNRSGQKMLRRDMIEDGYIRGLLVHPDWYDPPHPQEQPFDPDEGIAIYRPAPDLMPVPPAPVLLPAVHGGSSVTLIWTQTDPPGSTVVNWTVWRLRPGDPNFLLIGTVLPIVPAIIFISNPDLIPNKDGVTPPKVTGLTFTDTSWVAAAQYYVQTTTADTSTENGNGLISAPSNIVTPT